MTLLGDLAGLIRCTVCKLDKPSEAFNKCKKKTNGLSSYCRDCKKEKHKKTYPAYAPRFEFLWVQRRYGLTKQQAEYWQWRCWGNCEMCGKPETALGRTGKPKKLALDHCHKTGRVRGLICNRCNLCLYADDIKMLRLRIAFLERTQEMC